MEYKELTKEVDEKNHSLRLQTSDFRLHFALQITDNSFGKEKNREDSVIVPTHYLLLEILPILCK